ncbi:unnamed protein product, partial [Notodromas monacha]
MLLAVRKTDAVRFGSIVFPDEFIATDTLVFFRTLNQPGTSSYAVLINFSETDKEIPLGQVSGFPLEALVVTRSSGSSNLDTAPGSIVQTSSLLLEPHQGIVIEYEISPYKDFRLLVLLLSFFSRINPHLFIVLLQGGQILASLRKLAFFHAFTHVPVNKGTFGVHQVKLVIESGPGLGNGSSVGQHAHGSLHFGQIAAGHDCGRLVVDADFKACGAPVNELDRALGLDGGNGGVHVLRDNVAAIQHATSHETREDLDHAQNVRSHFPDAPKKDGECADPQGNSPTTDGSKSTKTALGTCLPAPVSLKKVLKLSSPPPRVLSEGICPSGWMPCSRQHKGDLGKQRPRWRATTVTNGALFTKPIGWIPEKPMHKPLRTIESFVKMAQPHFHSAHNRAAHPAREKDLRQVADAPGT